MPMIVVEDSPDVTVLFQAVGSVCKRRVGRLGGPDGRSMLPDGWDGRHEDRIWPGPPMLKLHVHGTAHSVLRSWSFEADRAVGWYVNLEAPWRRTALGFDSHDHVLDVTVADDLSSWAWKDEAELVWSVTVGKVSAREAEEYRAEGERVVKAVEARSWPFVEDWSRCRPEPGWPVPVVPVGWSDPTVSGWS